MNNLSVKIRKWFYGLIFALLVCLSSCKHIQYVPIETTIHDSVYVERLKVDSVREYDSIFVKEKGDTLYLYKYKYIDRYLYLHDTTSILRVDSVQVPIEIEKPLTKKQSFYLTLGQWCWWLIIVILCCLGLWLVLKVKKRFF